MLVHTVVAIATVVTLMVGVIIAVVDAGGGSGDGCRCVMGGDGQRTMVAAATNIGGSGDGCHRHLVVVAAIVIDVGGGQQVDAT